MEGTVSVIQGLKATTVVSRHAQMTALVMETVIHQHGNAIVLETKKDLTVLYANVQITAVVTALATRVIQPTLNVYVTKVSGQRIVPKRLVQAIAVVMEIATMAPAFVTTLGLVRHVLLLSVSKIVQIMALVSQEVFASAPQAKLVTSVRIKLVPITAVGWESVTRVLVSVSMEEEE